MGNFQPLFMGSLAPILTHLKGGAYSLGNELLKSLTNGFVNLKQIHSDIISGTAIEKYDEYQSIKKIKLDIVEIMKGISRGRKIIFFVDELDRAKPSFVVELVELIKHFFNTDNYYFVLLADRSHFNSIVRHYYGNEISSNDYLRKIVDYDFSLNTPSNRKYFELEITTKAMDNYNRLIFSKYLEWKKSNLTKIEKIDEQVYINVFIEMILEYTERYQFSLREMDRLISYIKLILPIIHNEYEKELQAGLYNEELNIINATLYYEVVLLCNLIFLRIRDFDLYQIVISGKHGAEAEHKYTNVPSNTYYLYHYITGIDVDGNRLNNTDYEVDDPETIIETLISMTQADYNNPSDDFDPDYDAEDDDVWDLDEYLKPEYFIDSSTKNLRIVSILEMATEHLYL